MGSDFIHNLLHRSLEGVQSPFLFLRGLTVRLRVALPIQHREVRMDVDGIMSGEGVGSVGT